MRQSHLAWLAAAPLLMLSGPPSPAAESRTPARLDCPRLCRDSPSTAPAECGCSVTSGTVGDNSFFDEDLSPREILQHIRADYERQIAAVNDYTIVEKSNVAPLPVVRHFEKTVVGGRAAMREVPLSELRKREAQANPQPGSELMEDPTLFLDGLAQVIDAFGGQASAAADSAVEQAQSNPDTAQVAGGAAALGGQSGALPGSEEGGLGGLLGALANGLRQAGSDVREQEKELEQEPVVDEFAGLPAAALDAFNDSDSTDLMHGAYFPEGAAPAQRFRLLGRNEGNKFICKVVSSGDADLWWDAINCPQFEHGPEFPWNADRQDLPRGTVPAFVVVRERPTRFEYGGQEYLLDEGQVWYAYAPMLDPKAYPEPPGDGPLPKVIVRMLLTVTALGQHQFRRMVIDRETDRHRDIGPMRLRMPHRTRERLTRDGSALPEIVRTIERTQVNEGPLTMQEIAGLLTGQIGNP